MKEQEATWGVVLRFWWAWTWRSILVTAVFGGILGTILGTVGTSFGVSALGKALIVDGTIYLVSIPVSIYIFKKVFAKDFGSFRIAIITDEDNNFNTQKH